MIPPCRRIGRQRPLGMPEISRNGGVTEIDELLPNALCHSGSAAAIKYREILISLYSVATPLQFSATSRVTYEFLFASERKMKLFFFRFA